MAFSRYVALGDSTTEGLEDPYPDGRGYRGWADRLAARLTAANTDLLYANLAVRGKLARQVREEQLELALALEPDLTTVVAGLNDTIRPRCDLDVVAGHLDAMIGALAAQGATVVTITFPDPAPVNPLAGRTRPRLFAYNELLRRIAERHGALIVDFERNGIASDPRLWHPDRLHANPEGHARIEAAFAETLGLPGASREWAEPLPPAPGLPRYRELAAHVTWAGKHLTPWVIRRIRGRSSGDGRPPKRPTLESFGPETRYE